MADSLNAGRALSADDDLAGAEVRDEGGLRMSFLDHLDELRRRILYSLYVLLACGAVTFYYWEDLYLYYIRYFSGLGGELIFNQPMAGFMFSLKISALAALVVAAPFVFSQMWLFVAPGLYAREKRVVIPFVFFSSALFFLGTYFAHTIAFPSMWAFFATYQVPGLKFMPPLDVVFSFYLKVVLGLGLVFQMPMVVFFLARFGIISAGMLIKQFKYAVLAIVILAAIITPSGDPINLAVFSVPMVGLYIVSIGVAWLFGKKRPNVA